MNKKTFKANSWLHQTQRESFTPPLSTTAKEENSYTKDSPPSSGMSEASDQPFALSKFLVPGWKGESLFSKSSNVIKKAQKELSKDIQFQLKKQDNFNLSLKHSIFEEYCSFIKDDKASPRELQEVKQFWSHLRDETSEHRKYLKSFLEVYSFRVATVYLYKIMFITTLSRQLAFDLKDNHLLFPNSIIGKLFKKGSSFELSCDSLKSNQFSWYRPHPGLSKTVRLLSDNLINLDIAQLMKLTAYKKASKLDSQKNFSEIDYSHALSHRAFGLFVNSLLIFFPIWHSKETLSYSGTEKGQRPDVMNTKYVGDKLYSVGHSHWLAQSSNLSIPWKEIICPDFSITGHHSGPFIRVCQELQFLSFLVQFSKEQNHPTKELLCHMMKKKYSSSNAAANGQTSLFQKETLKKDFLYERVFLNLINLPKTNPHHYLIQKIQSQKDSLTHKGQLLVFTNQKLFVPSQGPRVEQLLKDFKILAFFDFEKLESKGEVANYLYIIEKRNYNHTHINPLNIDPISLLTQETPKQEPCLNFRWRGELSQFGKFEKLGTELISFLKEKGLNTTSFFQKEVEKNLHFEFHQDALIEGKLLSSISEDSQSITHPSYFKKITQSCVSLESYFSISHLTSEENNKTSLTTALLGISARTENQYSYILIVDYRDPTLVRLEVCLAKNYKAKREEYGIAYFQYFGLTAKVPGLNINLFKEFFESHIGVQIIQLSLNGGPTKIKSKLKTLLIPKFFGEQDKIESSYQEKTALLQLSQESLLSTHPQELKDDCEKAINLLNDHSSRSPWFNLGLLSHFKHTLTEALSRAFSKEQYEVRYQNPLILNPLINLSSSPIYPNKEIFLDFLHKKREDLSLELSSVEIKEDEEGPYLTLFSADQAILRLYADKEVLKFSQFLLQSALGTKIEDILQGLRLPESQKLRDVLSNFELMETSLEELLRLVDDKIQAIISKQLTTSLK